MGVKSEKKSVFSRPRLWLVVVAGAFIAFAVWHEIASPKKPPGQFVSVRSSCEAELGKHPSKEDMQACFARHLGAGGEQ